MEHIYPIGTIVQISEMKEKYMIIGYLQQTAESEKIWDYVAVPFPQGFFGPDENVLFDEVQISEVISEGYRNEEQNNFMLQVKEFLVNNPKE